MELCREHDMGFIAMKGLSGGLLNNAEACYAFMQEYPRRGADLGHPAGGGAGPVAGTDGSGSPCMTPEIQAVIDRDRKELAGTSAAPAATACPCAAGIDIPQAARMAQLLRRAPV